MTVWVDVPKKQLKLNKLSSKISNVWQCFLTKKIKLILHIVKAGNLTNCKVSNSSNSGQISTMMIITDRRFKIIWHVIDLSISCLVFYLCIGGVLKIIIRKVSQINI